MSLAETLPPRVLIIEDDPGVAVLEAAVVEEQGGIALMAGTGAEVLALLTAEQPTLMLLDYSLPDTTAIALLEAIAARGLRCPPFIVATGAGDEYVAVDLMRRGASNYLVKDFDFLNVLPGAIRRALDDIALKGRLAAAEQRLRLAARVLEGTVEGVIVTDQAHQIIDINPALQQMTGYSLDDLRGNLPAMLLPVEARETLLANVILILESEGSWQGEIPLRCKDGSHKVAWFVISRILGESGEPPSYVTLVSDITARKQVEADLRISAIAFEAQEGMFITDAQRTIIRVNQAFSRISGYSATDAVGQTPRLWKSGHHSPSFYAGMTQRLDITGSWEGEIWNRRKDGEVYPEWLTVTAVKDDSGAVINYVATLTDITFRKKAEEEIRHLAFYDPLTRLPNRRLMADRLGSALIRAERRQRHGALMLLDLDNFKTLNDTSGHDAGDQLLVEVAKRLEACVRQGDTVARMGGDEFVVVLEDLDESISAAMQAEAVGRKILSAVSLPYDILRAENRDLNDEAASSQRTEIRHNCSVSIGIAMFADQSDTSDELMKRADTAMYQAKADGRNTMRFFDRSMQTSVAARA